MLHLLAFVEIQRKKKSSCNCGCSQSRRFKAAVLHAAAPAVVTHGGRSRLRVTLHVKVCRSKIEGGRGGEVWQGTNWSPPRSALAAAAFMWETKSGCGCLSADCSPRGWKVLQPPPWLRRLCVTSWQDTPPPLPSPSPHRRPRSYTMPDRIKVTFLAVTVAG